MSSFLTFLSNYYIWFLVAAAIFLFALIGLIIESSKKHKKDMEEQDTSGATTIEAFRNEMPSADVAPVENVEVSPLNNGTMEPAAEEPVLDLTSNVESTPMMEEPVMDETPVMEETPTMEGTPIFETPVEEAPVMEEVAPVMEEPTPEVNFGEQPTKPVFESQPEAPSFDIPNEEPVFDIPSLTDLDQSAPVDTNIEG